MMLAGYLYSCFKMSILLQSATNTPYGQFVCFAFLYSTQENGRNYIDPTTCA